MTVKQKIKTPAPDRATCIGERPHKLREQLPDGSYRETGEVEYRVPSAFDKPTIKATLEYIRDYLSVVAPDIVVPMLDDWIDDCEPMRSRLEDTIDWSALAEILRTTTASMPRASWRRVCAIASAIYTSNTTMGQTHPLDPYRLIRAVRAGLVSAPGLIVPPAKPRSRKLF